MKKTKLAFLLVVVVSLSGCSVSYSGQERPAKWTTGFWFWQGSSSEVALAGEPLDVLFVQVGRIEHHNAPASWDPTGPWHVYGTLPEQLPPAKEYWLVFRYDEQGVPDETVAPMLARELSELRAAARKRQLNVVGVQLDIDSPTNALPRYASFLREVRKSLPPGFQISITALLDWFRSGTATAEVIRETDEFVPQFYDVGDRNSGRGPRSIATKIDPSRWGPVFNRFRKRFRVGISTFGRAKFVPVARAQTGALGFGFFNDVTPLDIAQNPGGQLRATNTSAGELMLAYRAVRQMRISYSEFRPGDEIQFILATPEAIRAAVNSVQEMGGYTAGVVFFRWPSANETLTMRPEEALLAAGLRASERPRSATVHAIDGRCAAVACADLYFESATGASPETLRYVIRGSSALEYFLPEKNVPIGMTGPAQLELTIPPYCGRGRLYLGRAVSSRPSKFTVERQP